MIPTLKDINNNLDLFCANHGQSIMKEVIANFGPDKPAEKAENLITRTLGILQEHGIYAAFLWLFARPDKEKKAANKMIDCLKILITSVDESYLPDMKKFMDEPATNPMLNNINILLFVKQVMEQTLIYARYHAKAEGVKAKAADQTAKAGGANA